MVGLESETTSTWNLLLLHEVCSIKEKGQGLVVPESR